MLRYFADTSHALVVKRWFNSQTPPNAFNADHQILLWLNAFDAADRYPTTSAERPSQFPQHPHSP
jgi:hypothetical protein